MKPTLALLTLLLLTPPSVLQAKHGNAAQALVWVGRDWA
jgi:hypothetical protein